MRRYCFSSLAYPYGDRRDRDTLDVKAEDDNGKNVEQDVGDAADDKIDQRAHGIADRAENGRREVIEHDDRHTEEIDAHILRREVDDLGIAFHPFEEGI